MEPSFKDYFDKLTGSLDAIHCDIRSHTTKLDDLAQWLPDLERRVDQLAAAVAELQQARPTPTTAGQPAVEPAPPLPTPPAPLRDHVGTSKDTEGDALVSSDHGLDVLPWGLAPAFASVGTPANGPSTGHTSDRAGAVTTGPRHHVCTRAAARGGDRRRRPGPPTTYTASPSG